MAARSAIRKMRSEFDEQRGWPDERDGRFGSWGPLLGAIERPGVRPYAAGGRSGGSTVNDSVCPIDWL